MENGTLREKLGYRFALRGSFGAPDPCDEEDDDYDPCGSCDDITDKDLSVLLKEEAAKLAQSKCHENVEEALPAELNKRNEEPAPKEKCKRNEETTPQTECQKAKKKACKKFMKNPFFSNRLKLSSDKPPKPPTPPTQYLPIVEEVDSSGRIKCRKPKRKTCRKKGDSGEVEQNVKVCKINLRAEDDGGTDEYKTDKGSRRHTKEDFTKSTEENIESVTEDDMETGTDGDTESIVSEEEKEFEPGGSKKRKKKLKDKKKCKKKGTDKPLCKKKVSEVSISLLPPQIPPLQRELPLTSPKDIPEVERQILMACGNEQKKCKKQTNKCKTK